MREPWLQSKPEEPASYDATVFTGIVEQTAEVAAVADHAGGRRLSLALRWGDEQVGQSIAVNGCCLTIAAIADGQLHFDAIGETLDKTNLGLLSSGDRVHVERALRPADRLDGHFVLGHMDGAAELLDRMATERETRLRLRVPEALAAYIIPKGSVCLDGVSLTVASLDGTEFEVALIPTTLQKTLLGERPAGWPMNFEADILVKTVIATLARMTQAKP